MSELTDKERAFLIGLAKLTRETGIAIGGCGCCGSPSLDDAEITSDESGYSSGHGAMDVRWTDPADAWGWGNYRESIVR